MAPGGAQIENRDITQRDRAGKAAATGRGECQMSNSVRATARSTRAGRWLLVLASSLLVGPAAVGCTADRQTPITPTAPVAPAAAAATSHAEGTHTMPNGGRMTDQEMAAAWTARPAYVRQTQRTEAAYAFALQTGNVIDWMPCYCGCDTMGHRSNLDCYFKRSPAGSTRVAWEEHASYCQICVDITLTAKKLLGDGKSLLAIRQAVDRTYGSAGPGTDTALPAS
jgi:hypothetical protein